MTSQMQQQIEARLRDAILGLDIGPGERLTERAVEARFAASRTPVRAALLRLETEGLVRRDGRNWIVAPIDIAELEQLFVYREVLEIAAVRLACARAGAGAIAPIERLLRSCVAASPREQWHRVGMDFHIALAGLSGNDFLHRGVRDAMTRLSRARWLEVSNQAARDRAWSEHDAILDAVRAGHADRAATLLAAHVGRSRDRLLVSLRDDRRGLKARGFAVVAG